MVAAAAAAAAASTIVRAMGCSLPASQAAAIASTTAAFLVESDDGDDGRDDDDGDGDDVDGVVPLLWAVGVEFQEARRVSRAGEAIGTTSVSSGSPFVKVPVLSKTTVSTCH